MLPSRSSDTLPMQNIDSTVLHSSKDFAVSPPALPQELAPTKDGAF